MNSEQQQDLDRFSGVLDAFRRTSLEYAQDPESLANEMVVVKAFESLVESAWRALGSKIAAKGQTPPQSPKEIFVEAQNLGIIENADAWLETLDYRKQLKKSGNLDATQEALDFSQTYFTDTVDGLAEQWGL